jgi:RimJ/RimL family protein N-acetyltransferase
VLVGRGGFAAHEDGTGRELGYTLRRDLWGLGLATELATALVEWHRDHGGGAPLWAFAAVDNVASHRVLEKVGFGWVRDADHGGVPCALFHLDAGPVGRGGRGTR